MPDRGDYLHCNGINRTQFDSAEPTGDANGIGIDNGIGIVKKICLGSQMCIDMGILKIGMLTQHRHKISSLSTEQLNQFFLSRKQHFFLELICSDFCLFEVQCKLAQCPIIYSIQVGDTQE